MLKLQLEPIKYREEGSCGESTFNRKVSPVILTAGGGGKTTTDTFETDVDKN